MKLARRFAQLPPGTRLINLETKPGAGTKIQIIVPREAPLEFAAG